MNRQLVAGLVLALVAGLAQAQAPKQFEFRVAEVGSHILGTSGRAEGLPLNRRYAELDAGEKAKVRANYEAMPAGDEPPYPADGLLPVFKAVQTAKQASLGQLTLVADVDSAGKVRHVDTFGKVDAEFARFAARVLAATPFKPGRCAGKPCNMQYVLKMQIAGL
ncbi:hypothetical protein ACS5PN_01670 [Roseateles sp. NT4]|uniref:hypothetical protein n=1 Tax=Roseateles sp. NT4 TaxID=3453715 RepID=UPI003EF073B4